MVDKIVNRGLSTPDDDVLIRFVDNGDGTWSEVVNANGPRSLVDAAGSDLAVDSLRFSIAAILAPHYEVHEGRTFQTSHYAGSIADNASIETHVKVGGTPIHLTFAVDFGGDCEIEFLEDVNVSGDGTPLTILNMNRTSSGTTAALAYYSPIYSDGGILLHRLLPGGTVAFSIGGTIRLATEWILLANTSYVIKATNRSGAIQPGSIVMQWYNGAAS